MLFLSSHRLFLALFRCSVGVVRTSLSKVGKPYQPA